VKSKSDETYYVALIDEDINNKDDLMEDIKVKLNFPDYFGGNWDALYDCLCDLSWINEIIVIIKHTNIPKLPSHDLQIYIDLLQDAVSSWKEDESHQLIIEFPE